MLVLGMCFFLFGGMYHQEQFFDVSASKANNALLFMSCIAVVLPASPCGDRSCRDQHRGTGRASSGCTGTW